MLLLNDPTMPFETKPEETDFKPLAQHCKSIGVPLVVVPSGFDLTPPQTNSNDERNVEAGLDGDIASWENSLLGGDDSLDSWG